MTPFTFPESQRDVTADGPPFRIDRGGDWYHGDGKIDRPELVALFASILRLDSEGNYWLWHPGERCRVAVADAPFMVDGVSAEGGDITCTVRHRPPVVIGASHSLVMAGGVPYVQTGDGLVARFSTAAYYALVDLATRDGANLVITSAGCDFILGTVDAVAQNH